VAAVVVEVAVAAIRAADARRSPAPDRVLLFHIVTLPAGYGASFRAMRVLEGSGIVATDEMPGVKKTLHAAGFTYVAARWSPWRTWRTTSCFSRATTTDGSVPGHGSLIG
jgi:hypothetical protein